MIQKWATNFLLLPDGIHQRICLVRALVNRPKILILDEANTSLDENGDQLLDLNLSRSLHGTVTVIFVTHVRYIQKRNDASYELTDGFLTLRINYLFLRARRLDEVTQTQNKNKKQLRLLTKK